MRRVSFTLRLGQLWRVQSRRWKSTTIAGVSTGDSVKTHGDADLKALYLLEKHALWLSTYMIHHANNIRKSRDGLKVGGHQASSSSLATIMAVLYGRVLRPNDLVAVKPHASPMFHALHYMAGKQSLRKLQSFRAFGGAQSYPSRTKDGSDLVDISTGSVGLGPALTTFSALVQEYVGHRKGSTESKGKLVALIGDAELDEGNIYECLIESWKLRPKHNWWIIDYNRQSLDKPTGDFQFRLIDRMLRASGWNTVTIKYGKALLGLFETKESGKYFRKWLNECDNTKYAALTFSGGGAFRKAILQDIGDEPGVKSTLDGFTDEQLYSVLTNLGGHCAETLLEAFEANYSDPTPTVFICYTIKGYGLPIAGHKDNHGLALNQKQMDTLASHPSYAIEKGKEWDPLPSDEMAAAQIKSVLTRSLFFKERPRLPFPSDMISIPQQISFKKSPLMSTQDAFGQIMLSISNEKSEFAERIVTTSPDVATSTNLTGFINKRGAFALEDVPKDSITVPALNKWKFSKEGQHIPLGIAENNFFLVLAALGMSHEHFGHRLLPVGTIYDTFISRGLDALNYACYKDARFLLVATPSGITLGPEGGAHQSIYSPLIGMGQPGLTYYEPAFADELSLLMSWAFEHMQKPDGGSVYLRLSTRAIEQPDRSLTEDEKHWIVEGAYWRHGGNNDDLVVVYVGALSPEVFQSYDAICQSYPSKQIGLLQVTSPCVLFRSWNTKGDRSHISVLLKDVPVSTPILTILDGHPLTLSWLGGVRGHRVISLGVSDFGQSGDLVDLYHHYKIDDSAIVRAAESLLKSNEL